MVTKQVPINTNLSLAEFGRVSTKSVSLPLSVETCAMSGGTVGRALGPGAKASAAASASARLQALQVQPMSPWQSLAACDPGVWRQQICNAIVQVFVSQVIICA